jgi:microcystin degradation protein MlrC
MPSAAVCVRCRHRESAGPDPVVHRVGVIGFEHEANSLAAVVGRERVVDVGCRPGGLAASWEAGPLVSRLSDLIDLDLVELPVWTLGACGPLDHAVFTSMLDELDARVGAALADGALDAVVVLGHGAARTTAELDPDTTFVTRLRSHLGDAVPIVWVLDFHANVSAAMCELADVVVGYRTNPHVDIEDRLTEAADHAVRLMQGGRTCRVWCPTPLVLPQIALLTTPGDALADVMDVADAHRHEPVWNTSVFGGFSLADVPDCGVSVVITADTGHDRLALGIAAEIAERAVAIRSGYRTSLTPLAEATDIALGAAEGRSATVLLADVADNPGGGAPATSTAVLGALTAAGVTGALMGIHCDAEAVDAAWRAGAGATFDLVLNACSTSPYATRFDGRATVIALAEGPVVPERGVYAGARLDPGRSCAVDLEGIAVVVSSHPVQCADESVFRHLGLDPAAARVLVVKSRGHFRAGFDHLIAEDRIVEVSAPGVATNDLASVAWEHLPRPSFPLDDIDRWQPTPILCTGGPR